MDAMTDLFTRDDYRLLPEGFPARLILCLDGLELPPFPPCSESESDA